MKNLFLKSLLSILFVHQVSAVILFSESHVGIDFDDVTFDFEIHDVRKQDKKLLTLNSKVNKGNSFELANLDGVTTQEQLIKECESLKAEFDNAEMKNGDGFCQLVGSTKEGRRTVRFVMNKEKKKVYILNGKSKDKDSLKSEFDTLVSDLQTF